MKSLRPSTAARCAGKTSPTRPSFSVTCGPTPERGLSPAPCARSDFQRRACSWSTRGSTRGRNPFLALSVRKGLPVRGSSGCTGAPTPARGRITAPSASKAFPDTGTWRRTWRPCTPRWSLASPGKSSRVRTVTRAVTRRQSWGTTRGLTRGRGRTSAPTATRGSPCRGRWWGTSASTPASRPTTAPTAGRRSRSSGRWPPTCGLTRGRSRTAARSATRPSWLPESCGGTPGFTRGKSRTPAQAAGGTSRSPGRSETTGDRAYRTRRTPRPAAARIQLERTSRPGEVATSALRYWQHSTLKELSFWVYLVWVCLCSSTFLAQVWMMMNCLQLIHPSTTYSTQPPPTWLSPGLSVWSARICSLSLTRSSGLLWRLWETRRFCCASTSRVWAHVKATIPASVSAALRSHRCRTHPNPSRRSSSGQPPGQISPGSVKQLIISKLRFSSHHVET